MILDLGRDGIRELIATGEAERLLKAKGHTLDVDRFGPAEDRAPSRAADPEAAAALERQREKDAQRRRIELEYRARLYKAVVGKWKGPFKRPELKLLLALATDQCEISDELVEEAFAGKVPDEDKATEADVMRAVFARLLFGYQVESDQGKPSQLLDYAGRLKIDAKKIRAEVTKDLTPKAEPAAAKGKKK